MNVLGIDFNWPVWSRNSSGDNFYDVTSAGKWSQFNNNIGVAENHPILSPALLFVSKLFSQAQLNVVHNTSGKVKAEHYLAKLFRNPNFYQTLPDLLESLMFTQIANGVGVLYAKKIFGTQIMNAIHVLDYSKIHFPENIKSGYLKMDATFLNREVIYDKSGENIKIALRDLMFFYDLPNGAKKNPFEAASRLDGLKQTLLNTQDSLIAKNIILRTNGKEMLSGSKDGFPLSAEEKNAAEELFNDNYGLSAGRKRGLITKAKMSWQSMHIALRDLGLDESVKVDGNIIYTALHIPKDIISLEAKKTTYNNFKESMVSYIQNEMQATLNSFVAVFNKNIDPLHELKGTFEHLPIMQYILLERYTGISQQAGALDALRRAGIPDDIALEKCGFDKGIVLAPLTQTTAENGKKETTPKTSTPSEEESKIRKLIQA